MPRAVKRGALLRLARASERLRAPGSDGIREGRSGIVDAKKPSPFLDGIDRRK
jgi:hypothetical protein